jgi:AcrR family transcriptional regulator
MTTTRAWRARPEGPEYEQVRRRLVDAAEAVVRDDGASALRLDTVADRVGLHRSSVYRYFGSKEELITAVVVQATMRVGHKVIDRLGPGAPPEHFLAEGMAIALAELAADAVYRSLMAPSASVWMARVRAKALAEGIRPLVEPTFVAAAEQGLLRDGITPDDALRWLQIVASGLARSTDMVPDTDELTGLLERMLVPALLNDPVT